MTGENSRSIARSSMPRVRSFCKKDSAEFIGLVRALARYEKLTPPTSAAAKRLIEDIGRRVRVLVAESSGKCVGYAIYFFSYSSFLAKPTLYLEDLFILPEHRKRGIGEKIFQGLRRQARRQGCGRMEWIVLNWNKPAINFYAKLGAKPLNGWTFYRLKP